MLCGEQSRTLIPICRFTKCEQRALSSIRDSAMSPFWASPGGICIDWIRPGCDRDLWCDVLYSGAANGRDRDSNGVGRSAQGCSDVGDGEWCGVDCCRSCDWREWCLCSLADARVDDSNAAHARSDCDYGDDNGACDCGFDCLLASGTPRVKSGPNGCAAA